MLAQVSPDMLKGVAGWLVIAGALLWIYNQGREAFRQKPTNESLGTKHDELSRRVDVVEGDVRLLQGKVVSRDWFDNMESSMGDLRIEMQKQTDKREHQISELEKKIETLPERLLLMLERIRGLGRHEH